MAKTKKSPAFPKLQICNFQRIIAISIPSAEKVVQFLLNRSGNKEMALHFIGKKKIAALHADYFDDPSPTDCITFPYDDPDFLGEVFVCPQVAAEYVKKHGGSLEEELTLYVVHGFLHLLGLDDQTDLDREKMHAEEKKWIRALAKNKLRITLHRK